MKRYIILFLFLSLQYSHAQWEDAGWKTDPNITALTVCNGNLMRAQSNYIMTSSDLGSTWQQVSGIKTRVAEFAQNENSMIVSAGYSDGVHLSSDCGLSWERLSSEEIFTESISRIQIAGDTIIAGSYDGAKIFISTDLGKSWELKSKGLPDTDELYIGSIAFKNGTIFASIIPKYTQGLPKQGLYKSSDFGETWQYQGGATARVRLVFIYGGRVYTHGDGLLMSEDLGDTWTSLTHEEYVLTFNSNADKLYTGTVNGVFCSLDGGDNWIDYGLKGVNVKSIDFIDDKVIASSSQSLYALESPDEDWQLLDTLMNFGGVKKIAIKDDLIYTFGDDTQIMVSDDIGETWKLLNPMTKINNVSSFKAINEKLYLGSSNLFEGGLYFSIDNGKSWQLNKQLVQFSVTENLRVFSIFSHDSYIFLATDYGLFHSIDNGSNWSIHDNNIGLKTSGIASIGSELFIRGNPILLKSTTDYGQTWGEKKCNGLPPVNLGRRTLFAYESILFFSYDGAGEQSGLYISKDRGDNWDCITKDYFIYNKQSTKSVLRSFATDNYIFACTSLGIFVTIDEGENWTAINEGSRALLINQIYRVGDYLIVGSDGGFSRAKISDIADIIITAVPEEPPVATQENTVYPNPTDAYLHIDKYEGSPMDYEIFDYAGKKVLSGTLSGFKIDVSALPAAAYIVVLSNETQKHTMKFIKK